MFLKNKYTITVWNLKMRKGEIYDVVTVKKLDKIMVFERLIASKLSLPYQGPRNLNECPMTVYSIALIRCTMQYTVLYCSAVQ